MSDAQDARNTAQNLTNDSQAQTNVDQASKNAILAEGLVEVRSELARVNESLDDLNETVPGLHSEVDEKVTEALARAEDANREAHAIEDRVVKANKRLTIKVITPIVVLIIFAAANFYSLYETRQSADKIVDCLEPSGQCFKNNRASLGDTIEVIVTRVN
jgi:CHASE3 domain sensor protein